jgi:hypothetical protein
MNQPTQELHLGQQGGADADAAITPAWTGVSERVASLRWYDWSSSQATLSSASVGQQVSVDRFGLCGRHAVRESFVCLQRPDLQPGPTFAVTSPAAPGVPATNRGRRLSVISRLTNARAR